MFMHVVETADSGNDAAVRDAARYGRAAAMSRRRALAAGRSALAPAHERRRTARRDPDLRAPAVARRAVARPAVAAPAVAPDLQCASSGAQATPAEALVAINGVAAGRLGRALSMQRRRQLSQGKQALKGGGDPSAGGRGAGAPALVVYRGGVR